MREVSTIRIKTRKSLKVSLLVGLLTLALSVNVQGQARADYVVSPDRIGPVRVGMTVPQATKALGIPLVREAGYEGECYYVTPRRGLKGVSFMMAGRRIARIDIDAPKYTTDRGAKIGDSEARIKRLYRGLVEVIQHPYVDYGHYLRVTKKGSRFSIIFETDGKRVTSFRVGKGPEVGYIEGCS